MATYTAPVRDTLFTINDVLGMPAYANLPGFADATPDVVEAVVEGIAAYAEGELAPLNAVGDRQGCRLDGDRVKTPDGFPAAYAKLVEGGWLGLTASPDHGGQGLPEVLGAVFAEFLASANLAFGMYPGLSMGAYALLARHGSAEQKATYLPRLVSGQWTATMELTEPQCGTDLGLVRTKAEPGKNGAYSVTGNKIFISGGEHDLAENIIHLVLARLAGAPDGTKGLSLFLVPKFFAGANGALGERNHVRCVGLEEKMGIHGNATCQMAYDGATGWLVGEENQGLKAMFTMMNEARLGVGLQGLALSEVAYQNAAAYAKERRQGRAISGAKEPDAPADPIIVHPDVRRNLLDIRAFNEAARALVLWTSLRGALSTRTPDEKEAEAAEDHMSLMTPVIKGVLTDIGFANTVVAQQVFGGHGYITEMGVEQFVRDARIPMIYEGANGIQALDLVGRKLPRAGGRALMAFFAEVDAFIGDHGETEGLKDFASALKSARDDLEAATAWLMQNAMAKPDNAGAGANDYMHLMGLVALGLMWGRIALAATAALEEGRDDPAYYKAKLIVGRHFIERSMPRSQTHLARVRAGGANMMALAAEAF
jgi:hypothetical protein